MSNTSKPLSQFALIERAVRRTAQVRAAFLAADKEARATYREIPWFINDVRIPVVLALVDSLIDYLEWPRDQWKQDSGDLQFLVTNNRTQLHMHFNLTAAGLTVNALIGVSKTDAGKHMVFWCGEEALEAVLDRPDTLAHVHECLAGKIKDALVELANGGSNRFPP